MKRFLLLLLVYVSLSLKAQHTYTPAEISRLADLGKIWGMLHNFHPSMARGIINTDSLVSDVAASLANDPSAANFKACLEKMFARLKDPLTHVVIDKHSPVKLLTTNDSLPSYRFLADSVLYVALPTRFIMNDSVNKISWLQPAQLSRYKGVIFDIRNKDGDHYGDYSFMQGIGDSIMKSMIKKPLQMPVSIYRYQQGFINQRYGANGNIYSAGWQTKASDAIKPAEKTTTEWKSNLAIVVNRFSNSELLEMLLALDLAGNCKIIFDGDLSDYLNNAAIDYYTKADSMHLKLRVKDYIGFDGKNINTPDLLIDGITDENVFLDKCRVLALAAKENRNIKPDVSSLEYIHPLPANHHSGFAPVGERLFALYNYWNAIEYFAVYKHLLKQSWDSVLTEFIPKFINANDTISYYLTLANMISHIHDSHGFFALPKDMNIITDNFIYYVPLSVKRIAGKYYIVSIGKDSTQNLNGFRLWDEIITIDSIPVNTYKENFHTRFATSNDRTFERDMADHFLLSGAKNSTVQLTIMRNGKTIKQNAIRTSFGYEPDYKLVSFNDDHKDIEILPGNVGYVNMGSLAKDRVNKLFDTLMQTKAIVFDIRNYPRGTAWSIVPQLTDHDSVAVKFGFPYVTYESIGSPLIFKNSSYFSVQADKTKLYYKGKIIMLCNAETQSQAEYNIMMFQGAAGKRITVIGSATAGADGNVTAITLPGGYSTYFSGLEVLYPDGGQTQQTGIRVDIKIEPTLAGLKVGKDEILQRAIQFIETGK